MNACHACEVQSFQGCYFGWSRERSTLKLAMIVAASAAMATSRAADLRNRPRSASCDDESRDDCPAISEPYIHGLRVLVEV